MLVYFPPRFGRPRAFGPIASPWCEPHANIDNKKKKKKLQAEQADKDRLPAPVYHEGDEVWLLRRHIQTTRPSSKLDFKHLGRFKILKKVSSHTYKLDIPASMKSHPVYHVSLLEPVASDPLFCQKQPPSPLIIVDENPEWEVEEILDSKLVRKTLKYLVRWVSYDEITSEPAELLKNSRTLVWYFHIKYLNKPKLDYLT